ncbi:hypothetical protein FOZ60_004780 [Perkinsus olseni]|uniref:Uncharacterized protein n=1 Tax=Perkinsus olseni TaxID=32597 RepID=A0A7J6NT88_PEROL|nr:hypothetical protein FOZ60_004780 [Perkinsus olseni]
MRLALVVAVLLHASLGKDLPSKKPSFLAAGGTPPITSLYSQPTGRCYSSRGELKDCTCSNGTVPFFTEFYAWCPSSTRCLHTPDIGRSTESEMINAALFVLVQVLTCGLLMLQADANVLAVGTYEGWDDDYRFFCKMDIEQSTEMEIAADVDIRHG